MLKKVLFSLDCNFFLLCTPKVKENSCLLSLLVINGTISKWTNVGLRVYVHQTSLTTKGSLIESHIRVITILNVYNE